MDKSKKVAIKKFFVIFWTFLFFTFFSFCTFYLYFKENLAILIIDLVIIAVFAVIYVVCNLKNFKIAKFFLTLFVLFGALLFVLFLTKKLGFSSFENLFLSVKKTILTSGFYGVFVFVLFQALQVIISPIPGSATIFLGSQVYGAIYAFLYSTVGIIIGSIIAFLFARFFGKKIASFFVGEEKLTKYGNILNKHGKIVLPLIFLTPILPDDIVCIVSGLSTMPFKTFLAIVLCTRPLAIFAYCFVFDTTLGKKTNLAILLCFVFVVACFYLTSFLIKKLRSKKLKFAKNKNKNSIIKRGEGSN